MKRFLGWGKCVVRGFLDNHCPIHAAGLTYYSLLALVPILCCILVLAKTCGVDRYAKEQLNAQIDKKIAEIENGQDDFLAKLPIVNEFDREKKRKTAEDFAAKARNISNTLFSRIEKFDIETFGLIGFGFLLWTVISSLGTVEVCFNMIWGVTKPRPIWKRAYLYLFVIVVLPAMSAVAMSLPVLNVAKNVILSTFASTWLTQWVSDGLIWLLDSWIIRTSFTLATSSLSFGFFLWVLPNCKVNFRHAWYGGLITAILFATWMKLCAVAQVGIARSSALYGSFAFLPIVLAWFYMSWQIVLLGANMVRAFDEK